MGRRSSGLLAAGAAMLLQGAVLAAAAGPDLRLVGAAAGQDRDAVRTLIQDGVDVDASRADGVTALLWASHWDDREMVDLLLAAGADVNAAEDHGVTPLARACKNASAGIVERLAGRRRRSECGADQRADAADDCRADGKRRRGARAAGARGADPNASAAETGATALMWAMEEAHADVVRVLLEQGATVSASTTKGFTPLMTAARQGNIELASILIEAGARVNETGSDGTHALPLSILYGRYEFALFLLEHGADPNASMSGVHALHAAAGKVGHWLTHWNREHGGSGLGSSIYDPGLGLEGRLALVKALLAHGADPNVRIATSAMFMSYIGHPKRGAFERYACGTGDLRGATPLWVAAFGANSSFGQVFGEFAVLNRSNSSAAIITTLLEAGADMSLTTVDGTTPLMAAAGLGAATYTPREPRGLRSEGGEEAVRVLLAAGADINRVNEADFTALHGAAFRGLNEIVELLVENGADIDARDFRGRTPFRLAEGSKQSFQFQSWPETAELLANLGADTRLGVPGAVQERADRAVAE